MTDINLRGQSLLWWALPTAAFIIAVVEGVSIGVIVAAGVLSVIAAVVMSPVVRTEEVRDE
jgi:hypothetical protein